MKKINNELFEKEKFSNEGTQRWKCLELNCVFYEYEDEHRYIGILERTLELNEL